MIARFTALAMLACAATAFGQQPEPPPFQLEGLLPAGPRTSATESWGTLRFELANSTDAARDARVVVFYPEHPEVRYGRDVWLPPHSTTASWLTVGPAGSDGPRRASRELKFQLYERSAGTFRELRSGGDERLRARAIPFRKREPSTCVIADDIAGDPDPEALQFARVFRLSRGLSEVATPMRDRFLPPTPEAYDGTDHVILAGNRLAEDPMGLAAIRHWVQRGGSLWVMLDRVDLATVAPILGDDCGIEVVSRTSLTSVRLARPTEDSSKVGTREFDDPIDFARVRLGGNETVLFKTDGWPAAFSQQLGRGKVVFTTLGERAWIRPRLAREARSGFEHFPDLPVPQPELDRLAVDFYPEPIPSGLKPTDLEPMLAAEIGYSVVSREVAGGILFGFVACVIVAGMILRRAGRGESVGWLAPLLAVGTAAVLVGFGLASRRSVPATVSAVAVVEVSPGTREGSATGMAAVYRPSSGPVRVSTDSGGLIQLDATGLEGQSRQLIQTDSDERVWENMALPVGVRAGPIRGTVRVGEMTAVARFGPNGLTGVFQSGEFGNPADSILLAPSGEKFASRLRTEGGFAIAPEDRLAAGEYLSDGVVTDRQQRRVEVYRKYLAPMPRHLAGRTHLLTWVETPRTPVSAEAGERTQGSLLLVVPVSFGRPPPDSKVTVPLGFIPCGLAGPGKFTTESSLGMHQALRFPLPPSVLPLTVERATLVLKIRAPGRTVSIHGAGRVIREAMNPIDTIRIDVTDVALLELDADGGLRFDLKVSASTDADKGVGSPGVGWRIESIAMEVAGQTRVK